MPVHDRYTLQNVVTEYHGAYVMHRYIAILFGEVFVFVVRTRVALDSEARAIHTVFLCSFVRNVFEMDGLSRNWALSNNSSKLLTSISNSKLGKTSTFTDLPIRDGH